VDGHLLESDAELLRRGVMLDDGITKPAEVSIVAYHGNAIDANSHIRQSRRANTNERIAYLKGNLPKLSTTVEIAISEGRKRQIKRMLSFVGHPVLNLTRIVFATLLLDNLESGEWRYLNPQEIEALKALVND
jgi:pseudouridine synthase